MVTRTKLVDEARWSEALIGKALAHGLMNSRSVLVVPCCGWTGHEADLLIVETKLRIIDVEIKISRADLKADLKKDKWWKTRPWSRRAQSPVRKEWPDKVWKHYYCMPAEIWDDKLYASLPANSGILLLTRRRTSTGGLYGSAGLSPLITPLRRAKPNRDAKPITPADCIDIARLANLRMWSALTR